MLRIMKRIIVIFVGLALVLTGCGNTNLKPNQIQYEGKVLTYGATQVDDIFFEDGIDLVINKSNEVRCITITSADIITYNSISVGDKISKVESQYSYETDTGDAISVALSGNREVEPTSQDKPENTMWINYFHDEDKITKITIYDVAYGEKMK